MKSIKNILIFLLSLFMIVGCASKIDITTKNYIPEQAIEKNSNDYNMTANIIKSNPHWSKDLENETLRFNMFVQDTFNEIENKKEYLSKTYNVNYYKFDDRGFNTNNPNKINSKQEEKNSINSNVNILPKQAPTIQSNIKEIKMREEISVEKNNVVKPSQQNNPNNKTYDNQIFNEYNF